MEDVRVYLKNKRVRPFSEQAKLLLCASSLLTVFLIVSYQRTSSFVYITA